jgi:hypothetical protein
MSIFGRVEHPGEGSSHETAEVVNVPGGNGAVAEERSSANAVEEIATNPIAV